MSRRRVEIGKFPIKTAPPWRLSGWSGSNKDGIPSHDVVDFRMTASCVSCHFFGRSGKLNSNLFSPVKPNVGTTRGNSQDVSISSSAVWGLLMDFDEILPDCQPGRQPFGAGCFLYRRRRSVNPNPANSESNTTEDGSGTAVNDEGSMKLPDMTNKLFNVTESE